MPFHDLWPEAGEKTRQWKAADLFALVLVIRKPYQFYKRFCPYHGGPLKSIQCLFKSPPASNYSFPPAPCPQAKLMEAVEYLARCKHIQVPRGWDPLA